MNKYNGPKNVTVDTPDGNNAERIKSQEWERLFGTTMWDPDGPQPGMGKSLHIISPNLFMFLVLCGIVFYFVHVEWHMI